MARNPVAQTAFGPMVLAAVEQNEPPGRRLVDDDLAELFLPAPLRWLVAATRSAPLRRLMIRGSECTGPGLWANLACRKRFIADKLERSARRHRRGCHPRCRIGYPPLPADPASPHPRLRGRPAGQHRQEGRDGSTGAGWVAAVGSVGGVGLRARRPAHLAGRARLSHRLPGLFHLRRRDPIPHRRRCPAHAGGTARGRPGSRLVFTYVRRDFIDGTNRYGTRTLYRNVRQRHQLWHFGLQPDEVAGVHRRLRLAAGGAGRAR